MDLELAKLVGSGGFGVALLVLLYVVGMRLVASLDKLSDHVLTQGEALARVEGALGTRTPPGGYRLPTSDGVPTR